MSKTLPVGMPVCIKGDLCTVYKYASSSISYVKGPDGNVFEVGIEHIEDGLITTPEAYFSQVMAKEGWIKEDDDFIIEYKELSLFIQQGTYEPELCAIWTKITDKLEATIKSARKHAEALRLINEYQNTNP